MRQAFQQIRYYLFGAILSIVSLSGLAQTNVVAVTPNADMIGHYNTIIGNSASQPTMSGDSNVFIGAGAGKVYLSNSKNVAIGAKADMGANNLSNATAIGYRAVASVSNSVVLGNGANVGIGTSAPQNKLEITKGTANQSGLRLSNLTSNSPATVSNQYKFLTVNASGDVILGSLNSSTRQGVKESFWQRKGLFLRNTKGEGVIIGANIVDTPSGYKLFVEGGILAEKVKVAVKNTSEWSDKVFDDTYSLKGLSEVENYIKINRHLPGVPSAKDIVNQGIDVAKMDAKLLEKIEELTLYILQQQKALQAQQCQINELRRQIKPAQESPITKK